VPLRVNAHEDLGVNLEELKICRITTTTRWQTNRQTERDTQ